MAVSFEIIPERALVYVRYVGEARVDEGRQAFAAFMSHPDFNPTYRQVVDLSGVTSIERDFARLLAFQAAKAEAFLAGMAPMLLVYYAPSGESLSMARIVQRSWDGIDGVIVRIVSDEEAVRDILGLPDLSLNELATRVA